MYEDGAVLHLVSDQTSADEVRGLTADFEELVHAEHERLFPALALITRDPASPSLRPKLRRQPGAVRQGKVEPTKPTSGQG